MTIDPSLKWLLAVCMIGYLIAMYAIGLFAQRKIHNAEDFIVAGRKLPLSLAWMTLLATWFGAATMLGAADEVRQNGLQSVAIDPLGAGFCLLFAGLFVAGPMWRMQLLTVPDFFLRKFGPTAEFLSSIIMVPSYFGWIAVQFTALAEMLQFFFGIPVYTGLLIVAVVGTGYTLMGGMWSVTLTDAVQVSLVLGGLIVLGVVVLVELGNGSLSAGWSRIGAETDPEMLVIIPRENRIELLGWISAFLVGSMGSVPGQDLMQRVFSSNSERTAKRACLISGVAYLAFGAIPLMLALAGNLLMPEDKDIAILPAMAHEFLHPVVAVIFVVALLSAVLSTIDSAILSPASVLSQNVFPRFGYADTLRSNRISVSLVAGCSLFVAYLGENAFDLLEASYSLTLVGLFVPLMIGLYSRPRHRFAANVAMLTGSALWVLHYANGWETFFPQVPVVGPLELPDALCETLCALLAYFVCEPPWRVEWTRRSVEEPSVAADAAE